VLAAYQEGLEEMMERRGLYKRTPLTINSIPKIKRELARVRELGYGVDDEENSLGVRCVAAPVFNSEGKCEAALGLSGTTYDFERANIPRVAELVKAAARKLSHQLGAIGRR
jgi:DNA-binding IclR family transcriptional regulator